MLHLASIICIKDHSWTGTTDVNVSAFCHWLIHPLLGTAQSAPLPDLRVFSSGLPFGGLIFYGAPAFAVGGLDNSIKIKGLSVALSLWRAA
jgi:hypothetical protein